MGTDARWKVKSIDLSNDMIIVLANKYCYECLLMAIEKEIRTSYCLTLGLSDLYSLGPSVRIVAADVI